MIHVALVGCGKAKSGAGPRPARSLYTGGLFRSQLAHAEATADADKVWIVSALHGLVDVDQMLEPYDQTLGEDSKKWRAVWAAGVVTRLVAKLEGPFTVTIYAGAFYAEAIKHELEGRGVPVFWPVKGMGQGKRLAFYKREREKRQST